LAEIVVVKAGFTVPVAMLVLLGWHTPPAF
jgi:hypothetical protein